MSAALLCRNKPFLALFITQFSGAFNDNFYKSALLMLFTYGGLHNMGLGVDVINNLVAVTLIIPFIILAPLAGQYADKFDRAKMIRHLKVAEIVFMLIGALGIWLDLPLVMLLVLVLTGMQSACFSPLKYSAIPAIVAPEELVSANGVMHAGTSTAIFSGLIVGSLMMSLPMAEFLLVGVAVAMAVIGWCGSLFIEPLPIANKAITITHNPIRQLGRVFGYARADKLILWIILALSWYWFMGSIYLAQIPNLVKQNLHGQPLVVTLLMTLFLMGTFWSAFICGRFSGSPRRTQLIVWGGVAVTIFGVDLYFACNALAQQFTEGERLISIWPWLSMPGALRVLFDVMMVGAAGGVYMVPLFALLQGLSKPLMKAQILSANTVVNALFMVLAAVVGVMSLGVWKISIIEMLLLVSLLHLVIMTLLLRGHPHLWAMCIAGDVRANTARLAVKEGDS